MIDDGNLYALLSPAAAFIAGALVSLHCVGMCGPLSCALIGQKKGVSALPSHGVYHLGRLIAYTSLGALVGALGSRVVSWVGENPARFAPWALAAFFVALACNLDGIVTRWQAKSGIGRGIVQRAYRLSGHARGFSLGIATPLIPCGPLYLMLWATTMSGSAGQGALVMLCFAIGTMPLMLLAQTGWAWLSLRMDARKLGYLRRVVALVAVGLLCFRAFMGTDATAVVAGEGICK
ncbi:sulfite exporter TauE/SafE family protein [Pelagicoccus sp. SDUM812005]|uniref:sulfite exporter TauE/SafE family protein n=1 Tax=Pelagicoccus sp. SDUM812005 TaxID=3041257 RepID=UPI00280D01FE|nr:sulfite exporter TauE/SafE family protein [Pelagicoccus sp. SDUM812005]MDQ8179878.1 sulfite exporter TauE/SafE family protein [Pelagicoccus sp. SDUM812005]